MKESSLEWSRFSEQEIRQFDVQKKFGIKGYTLDPNFLLLKGPPDWRIMNIDHCLNSTLEVLFQEPDYPKITAFIDYPQFRYAHILNNHLEPPFITTFEVDVDKLETVHRPRFIFLWNDRFPKNGRAAIRWRFIDRVNPVLSKNSLPTIPTLTYV